jgi:hypothetical protein
MDEQQNSKTIIALSDVFNDRLSAHLNALEQNPSELKREGILAGANSDSH